MRRGGEGNLDEKDEKELTPFLQALKSARRKG